jgi:transcriptional regulator of nitric oxide reductase
MFDGSLRPNAATDSNSTEPSWPGLKMAKKRRWETLLMNGSGERLQSGKGEVRARRSAQANGISILTIYGICAILDR